MMSLPEYYSRRAPEYEQKFRTGDPLRQSEQDALVQAMRKCLSGRRVLEIACGTGFWTQFIADVAEHIIGLDLSWEMLALARNKKLPADKVEFLHADAFQLPSVPGHLNAGLVNFFLSHIPRARTAEFLAGFHRKLGLGAVVFAADDRHVSGSQGKPLAGSETADTFQQRALPDGTRCEVLKNYYDAEQLRKLFAPVSRSLHIHVGEFFWRVSYAVG